MQGPGAAGLHGHARRRPEQMTARLEFAQCVRDNGVKDFPDPTRDGPLVDTNRIPSSATAGGMSILNAAMQKCRSLRRGSRRTGEPVMRKRWVLAGAAVAGRRRRHRRVVVMSSAAAGDLGRAGAAGDTPRRWSGGALSDMVSQYGTLTYRARADGSPYSVINQARGTYTKLPDGGDMVDCGDVLYRVDDKPVLLLCGSTPAYRSLSEGDSGPDVPSSTPTWCTSDTRPGRSSTRPLTTSAPRRRPRSRSCSPGWARPGPGRWTSAMRCSCPSRCGSPR